jgi:hypothetical protein
MYQNRAVDCALYEAEDERPSGKTNVNNRPVLIKRSSITHLLGFRRVERRCGWVLAREWCRSCRRIDVFWRLNVGVGSSLKFNRIPTVLGVGVFVVVEGRGEGESSGQGSRVSKVD